MRCPRNVVLKAKEIALKEKASGSERRGGGAEGGYSARGISDSADLRDRSSVTEPLRDSRFCSIAPYYYCRNKLNRCRNRISRRTFIRADGLAFSHRAAARSSHRPRVGVTCFPALENLSLFCTYVETRGRQRAGEILGASCSKREFRADRVALGASARGSVCVCVCF